MKRQNVSALLSASLLGIALLMFSASAEAQSGLSIDAQSSHDNTSTSTTNSTSAFSTRAANELLLAFVASDYAHTGPNVTVTGVAGGGLTWQLVERTNFQFGTAEIWRAFAVSQLSNVSVTATLSQTVYSSITVVSFIGADPSGSNGSGAIGAVGSSEASTGAPSVSLITTRNNSWVFGVGVDYDNATNRTPGSSQSLVHQFLSPSNDTYWVQQQTATTNQAGTTVLINDTAPTGDRSDMSSVEILPAPASDSSGLGVDVQVSSDVQTASSTNSTPAFSTGSSNELLLAFISADKLVDPNTTVTGISGAGVTWELVQRTNAQPGDAEIWRAFATTPLSNVSVTATLSQAVVSSMTVISFIGADASGINGSGAIGATATGSSSSGAPSAPLASLTTTRDGSWVLAMGDDFDKSIPRVVGTSQTLRHEYFPPVNDTYWVQSQTGPTPHSGTVVTINDTAPSTDRFNLSLVEVLPGQAASGGPSITSVSPSIAAVGSAVTITGVNFGAAQGSSTVTFGGVVANVNNWSATSIIAGVPTSLSAGSAPIIVTVPANGPSNAEAFTVDAAPVVSAGPNRTIQLPVNTVTLIGTATDDGVPNGTLSIQWTQVSGPGTVSFSNPASAVTNATFSAAGTYDLRLTANDSALQSSSDTTVTVLDVGPDQPPVVNAGPNLTISSVPGQAHLNGTVADDGFPVGGQIVSRWTTLSGPGTVTFSNPSAPNTTATFSAPGVYVLTLNANDGEFTGSANVTVTVVDANQSPTVTAGPMQTITWPANSVTLAGTATDDGLPNGTLSLSWTQITGAGTTVFSNPNALNTSVTFSKPGTYDLRLTASDSQLSSSSDVLVFVGHLDCARSTKGTDFWLTFMGEQALGRTAQNQPQPSLYVTSDTATSGQVTMPGQPPIPFDVQPGQVATVVLPSIADLADSSDLVTNYGVHVIAENEITVFTVDQMPVIGEGFTALPTDVLGTDYITLGYENIRGAATLVGSEFAIVATADNTNITITPASNSTSSHLQGIPYTIALNQGNTYQLRADTVSGEIFADLSGSIIHSDKPIAVFAGHDCVFIPSGSPFCDAVMEEMPPVSTWGTHFLGLLSVRQTPGDDFRIVASQDNTHVYVNGAQVAVLGKGQVFEKIFSTNVQIWADHPVLVAQYGTSESYGGSVPGTQGDADPFMVLVPPLDQFGGSVTIAAPNTGFGENYVNVIAPSGAKGVISIDGNQIPVASYVDIGSTGFSGVQLPISIGAHTLTSVVPFGTSVYGYGLFDGYGYVGTACYASSATDTTVSVTPTTNNAPVGSQACVTVTVNDANSNPTGGAGLELKVSGVSSAAASLTTNASGQAQYCYTGTTQGSDLVTATSGDVSSSASVQWTTNGPNQPPAVNAGANQTITLPTNSVILNGSVFDDGLPTGSTLAILWSQVSGPAAAAFSQPNQAITSVTFSTAGTYVLQLSANDSQLSTNAIVTVTVNTPDQPPVVTASVASGASLFPHQSIQINGQASDPDGSAVTLLWSLYSGPSFATFSSTNTAVTFVSFSQPGSYVLALSASDGRFTSTYYLPITIVAQTQPPIVTVSPNQTVYLPNSATVTASYSPQTPAASVQWGGSGPGQITFSNPTSLTTQVSFAAPGTYSVFALVTSANGSSQSGLTITVIQPAAPAPTVSITPLDQSDITKLTGVTGTITGASGTTYVLDYSPIANDGTSTQWKTISNGTAGTGTINFGTFDPTMLLNGQYTVRVTATDPQGQTFASSAIATVRGNMKIGVFSVSFNDLTVPMPGLPIQIIRTYDSRDTSVGEFGVGWHLSISNAQLRKNGKLGIGWNETAQFNGGFPTYCLDPTKNHFVTIALPDGKLYKFIAGAQCQNFAPIEVPQITFQQMPTGANTAGASLALVESDAIVDGSVPGPVDFIDFSGNQYDGTLFQLTTAEGFVYVIDQHGGVQSVTDPNGNKLTITANGIFHSSGKNVVFNRDAQGRISSITDVNGNNVNYRFNDAGDLQYFVDAAGNVTTFTYQTGSHLVSTVVPPNSPAGTTALNNTYDSSTSRLTFSGNSASHVSFTHDVQNQIETVFDGLSHSTTYTYDDHGNIIQTKDALGNVSSATYDGDDNKLAETNGLGKTTTYTYDALGNRLTEADPLGNTTTYTYDSHKHPLTITDANGNVTANTYDSTGNLLTTKDGAGITTTYTYTGSLPQTVTDALNHTTTFTYDSSGNLKTQTDALHNVTNYTYDNNGNKLTQAVTRTKADGTTETLTTQYVYDAKNRLVKTIAPDSSTTQTVYDGLGRRTASIDALTRQTKYTLDINGNVLRVDYPDSTFETMRYDANNRRTSFTDRNQHPSSYTYDADGHLTQTSNLGVVTQTGYDAAGRVSSTTDAASKITHYGYDDAGRRQTVTDPLGNVTTFGYDQAGNQTSITDANQHTTTYVYDKDNRRTQTIFPDQTTETIGYDVLGRMTSKTDQAGKVTNYGYDALGRLMSVTQFLNGNPLVTSYGYDEVGNRISQTDANNHTTTYSYDRLGRRLSRTLPLGQSESYAYDANGNVQSRTDFNGHTTTYAYDTMNRLLSKTADVFFSQGACANGACGATQVSFTYTNTGKRASMTDASGTPNYTYDGADRLSAKTTPEGTINYFREFNTERLSETRSSNGNGSDNRLVYDADGRLSQVIANSDAGSLNSLTTTYGYDPAGNLQNFSYPNGVSHGYTYDALNRLTNLSVSCGSGAPTCGPGGGTNAFSYAYTLGAAGNRTKVTELSGRTVQYGYDDLYRLTSETIAGATSQNGTIGYTYDAVGNRQQITSTVNAIPSSGTLFYDANDRTATDTYDNNGNTVAQAGTTNVYDFENHLVRHGAMTIVYDGDGNRVAETIGGVTTKYQVDDQNLTGYAQVVEELQNGSVVRKYSYGLERISENQLISGAWKISFYNYDGHGSVRALTNNTGVVTDTYDYDAFGNLIASTGSTGNSYLYAGEQFDPNLGLYYNRARYLGCSEWQVLEHGPSVCACKAAKFAASLLVCQSKPSKRG